ncbi:hypothetical protein HX109_04940 [Galbibacter sp. BG1]|uniref:hypothetical protein n=1 Tax=Galbibacter sp. BG1 TaxID=1170699 RepID=UPI0015C04766|nr:hypothetical protein [Galbibacter sp. BG1]QLE00941.1 hypothetical protein HX109_04940 [Galbibacter sp. BG1]
MKNLENLGVQKLSVQEMNRTEGGIVGFIIAGVIGGYKMEAMKNGEPWYWPAFVPYN